MKTPRIANAIVHIDDDLVSGAAESKKKKKNVWVKWGSLAACFAVLIIASVAVLLSLFGGNVTPGGADGRYKNYNIYAGEYAIVWPWEYLTVYEKYTNVEIDGIEYLGKGRAVSEALVGESIGNYTMIGYDKINNGKKYTAEFEAYALKDIAQSQFVAVKMEDSYYVFQNDEYAPPRTLGELMDVIDLSKVVELSRFCENDDSPDSNHFVLGNDDYIWEVLAGCKSASFVEDQTWMVGDIVDDIVGDIVGDRDYLSFTVTSEALGVYKAALYVTEDGYLWTNAFNLQYLFNIGEDAASKIINYAKENSIEADYEPYINVVAGTIIEITEEYILMDDSILCKNPEDGITYKVMLNDLRISRYVDYGVIKVGDTVQISYNGEINKNSDNTIEGAISASKATISNRDIFIPE